MFSNHLYNAYTYGFLIKNIFHSETLDGLTFKKIRAKLWWAHLLLFYFKKIVQSETLVGPPVFQEQVIKCETLVDSPSFQEKVVQSETLVNSPFIFDFKKIVHSETLVGSP